MRTHYTLVKTKIIPLVICTLFLPIGATAEDTELVAEAYTESSGTYESSDNISGSGSGGVSTNEASIEVSDYEYSYSSGCKVSLTAFAGYDWVVAGDDDTPDPDIPAGESVLYLSLEEYHCLFPMDAKEVTFSDPVTAFLEIPEVANATADAIENGNVTDPLDWFVPNATAYDVDPLDQTLVFSGPGATLGLNPGVETWNVVTGYHNASTDGSEHYNGAVIINPRDEVDEAEDALPEGPSPASSTPGTVGGRMWMRVIMPERYTYNSNGDRWYYYPSNGCNMKHFGEMTREYMNDFRNPSTGGRMSWTVKCYLKSPYLWDPCERISGGSNHCTRNSFTLMDRLNHFIDSNFNWMHNGANELVMGVVSAANNNGIAEVGGHDGILAERALIGPDSPHTSILMHETGHNFGASHYPNDGYRKYVCRQRGNGNWVYYDSVMNYCHMKHGWTSFDWNNWNTVRGNLW